MNRRVTLGLVVAGTTVISIAALAAARNDTDVPEGPEVDFCPTQEQAEAHLEQYGFDYKPTVECDVPEEGDGDPSGEPAPDDNLSSDEADAYYDEQLRAAEPLPDSDGDPTTIEGKLPDGREVTVIVEAGNPEEFEGMDIDEYAAGDYP